MNEIGLHILQVLGANKAVLTTEAESRQANGEILPKSMGDNVEQLYWVLKGKSLV